MPKDLEIEVDTRVTPALHPQLVGSLVDFDSETEGHLQQAVDAFHYAYRAVAATHDARDAVREDPTLTEPAQIVRTADHADKMFKTAAAQLDKVRANMLVGIDILNKEMTAPLQARATHTLSVEVRSYLRELKEKGKSPLDFVRNAVERGDADTVSAALGGPAYLAGLEPAMQDVLLRMWNEKLNPGAAKRLRAMQGVVDLIHKNGPLLHEQLEKAIGVPAWKVREYRAAKARTDKAFAS
jgi:hypothetical protein